ncbi:hypothetical protein TCEA9_09830 [Thermobrachium celere]|nr:hypothetical protein TCEA9_09830 [Thermobrachium celere]
MFTKYFEKYIQTKVQVIILTKNKLNLKLTEKLKIYYNILDRFTKTVYSTVTKECI